MTVKSITLHNRTVTDVLLVCCAEHEVQQGANVTDMPSAPQQSMSVKVVSLLTVVVQMVVGNHSAKHIRQISRLLCKYQP